MSITTYPSGEFHKTRNPKMQYHHLMLRESEKDDRQVTQYYFLNNFNEIQLLYPNHSSKFARFRILDLVAELSADYQTAEKSDRKKIMYQNVVSEKSHNVAISRELKSLCQILNMDRIETHQSLQFVIDSQHQVFYCSDPAKARVKIIFQKEQHTEELFASEGLGSVLASGTRSIFSETRTKFVPSARQRDMERVYRSICGACVAESCKRHLCQDSKKVALIVENYAALRGVLAGVRVRYPFDAHDCNVKLASGRKLTMDAGFMRNIILQAKETFGSCCNSVECEHF